LKEKSTMSPKISGLSMAFRPPLIWLLIYFLTTPISLYDYVVCIGLDGHIELETAHGGKCTIPFHSTNPSISLRQMAKLLLEDSNYGYQS